MVVEWYNCEHMSVRMYSNDIDAFWSKVNKSADGCWTWVGGDRHVAGYGLLRRGCVGEHRAHRISWVLHYGPIPNGLYVCHHCDNRPCVRPDHLFVGTATDNMQDMIRKGRSAAQVNPDHYAKGEEKIHKLTTAQVADIRMSSSSRTALSVRYGVSVSCIGKILRREGWRHIA